MPTLPAFRLFFSRFNNNFLQTCTIFVAFGTFSCGEGAESWDDYATLEQELSADASALLKPATLTTHYTDAKFCFDASVMASKYNDMRRAVQNAVDQWSDATSGRLRLGTIQQCGSGVRITVESTDYGGYVDNLGVKATKLVIDNDHTSYDVASIVAAHELGHAFGFTHEANHPDSTCNERQPGDTTGGMFWNYDAESIMNYCGGYNRSASALLSSGDKEGIARIFGRSGRYIGMNKPFLLRSQNGAFIKVTQPYPRPPIGPPTVAMAGMGTPLVLENADEPGAAWTFGDDVTLRDPISGKYLRARGSVNRAGPVYSLEVGDRAEWRVRGFHDSDDKVGVNQEFGLTQKFTFPSGTQPCGELKNNQCINQVYLRSTYDAVRKTTYIDVQGLEGATPPEDSRYLWRGMGPM